MEYCLKTFQIDMSVTKIANIHYFEFSDNYHTQVGSHDFPELIYVDNGSIDITSRGFTGRIKEGQLVIHEANEAHSLTCPMGTSPNVIIIGFECNSPLFHDLTQKPHTLSPLLQKQLAEIIKEGRNVFMPPYDMPNVKDMKKRDNFDFGADQMIKILLESFLIRLYRASVSQNSESTDFTDAPPFVNEIKRYIDENVTEKITLSELCLLFGTNKTSLCSSFKKYVGTTIIDYVNTGKIKYAKRKIREGKSVTEIAVELGLSSINYLTRLFEKYERLTPSEYARSVKSKFQ